MRTRTNASLPGLAEGCKIWLPNLRHCEKEKGALSSFNLQNLGAMVALVKNGICAYTQQFDIAMGNIIDRGLEQLCTKQTIATTHAARNLEQNNLMDTN